MEVIHRTYSAPAISALQVSTVSNISHDLTCRKITLSGWWGHYWKWLLLLMCHFNDNSVFLVPPQASTYDIPKKEKRQRKWRSKNNSKETKSSLQVNRRVFCFVFSCTEFLLSSSQSFIVFVFFFFSPPGTKLHFPSVASPPCLQPQPLHLWVQHPGPQPRIPGLTNRRFPSTGGLLQAGQQQWGSERLLWRHGYKMSYTISFHVCLFFACSPRHAQIHFQLSCSWERETEAHHWPAGPTASSGRGPEDLCLSEYLLQIASTRQPISFDSTYFLFLSGLSRQLPFFGPPGVQWEQSIYPRVHIRVFWRSRVSLIFFLLWEWGETPSTI